MKHEGVGLLGRQDCWRSAKIEILSSETYKGSPVRGAAGRQALPVVLLAGKQLPWELSHLQKAFIGGQGVFHLVILLNKLCDLYVGWALIHSPNSYSFCNSV